MSRVVSFEPPPRDADNRAIHSWLWRVYNRLQASVVEPLGDAERSVLAARDVEQLDTAAIADDHVNRAKINELIAALKQGGR